MNQAMNSKPIIGNLLSRSKYACERLIPWKYFGANSLRAALHLNTEQGIGVSTKTEMSILACDIVGSTDMAQSVSPEKLQKIVYAYHDYCTGLVSAQSGNVARYMGDDCLAFFEAEEISCKHASRAVRAAESMLRNKHFLERTAGHPLNLRLGIATGIVIRDESRIEQSIVGEPLHLANRLQLIGQENSITVCPKTRYQTNSEMNYTEFGCRKLKGYTDMIQVWTYRPGSKKQSASASDHFRKMVG